MVIRYKKLIFVDTNDNCRAPMAELILKRKFLTNPLTIESRGLVVLFPEPMNPKAEAILENHGYPTPVHVAMQLEQEDISRDVLLITMEEKQKSQIWETYEDAPHVYTLKEYVGESGDIPPLYGQPLSVYSQCYTEMELLIRRLVIIPAKVSNLPKILNVLSMTTLNPCPFAYRNFSALAYSESSSRSKSHLDSRSDKSP